MEVSFYFVGELQYRKNHQVVIEALNELQDPSITYLIAGQGELYESYQKLIRDNNMSNTIKLITEDTPVSLASCYGDSKVQAENGIHQLTDDNFRVVILRPPMIYGKGSKGNYPLLSKIAQKISIFPYVKN